MNGLYYYHYSAVLTCDFETNTVGEGWTSTLTLAQKTEVVFKAVNAVLTSSNSADDFFAKARDAARIWHRLMIQILGTEDQIPDELKEMMGWLVSGDVPQFIKDKVTLSLASFVITRLHLLGLGKNTRSRDLVLTMANILYWDKTGSSELYRFVTHIKDEKQKTLLMALCEFAPMPEVPIPYTGAMSGGASYWDPFALKKF